MFVTTNKGQYLLKDLEFDELTKAIVKLAVKDQCTHIYVDIPFKSYVFVVKLMPHKKGSRTVYTGYIEDYKIREWR